MKNLDIDRLREETPGCAHVTHLNNAGASLMPQAVVDAVIQHLQLEATIGGYEAAEVNQGLVEDAYDAASTLLNCSRDEIAFVENATRAWDMVFYAIPFQAGDRILTAAAEYASNYIAFLQVARRHGVTIDVVPNDETGQVSVDALERMLDDRVRLVAITHIPTNGGLVNPARDIGKLTRARNVLYLLDACQSVGQMPVDVEEIGCDMLSTTGRKYLRGPRGTGFLYVRSSRLEQLEPPFLDLHAATWTSLDTYRMRDDARRFENWETNVAGKIGLRTAIRYAMDVGLDAIRARVFGLAESLRSQLQSIRGVTLRDEGRQKCGIVTFSVATVPAQEVVSHLREANVNVSVSEMQHAHLDRRRLPALVRASVHYYNTETELGQAVEVLDDLMRARPS
jgi:selenocysteine lyase/cysteine desulfurase